MYGNNSTEKRNSRWIKDLSVTPETIKLSEENIGRTLYDKSQQNSFDPLSRVMKITTKINKRDLIKFKSFFTAKKTIS